MTKRVLLPLETYLEAPRWVKTDRPGAVPWWPVARMNREGRVGIVVVADVAPHPEMLLIDAGAKVATVKPQPPIETPPDGEHVESLRFDADTLDHYVVVAMLARAAAGGLVAHIGYRKGEEIEERRIGRIVPGSNGAAIVCADLDKDAPRSFRLDKIAWVLVVPAEGS